MRRDGGKSTHFLIIRNRNIWAWRTDNPKQIESLEEISISRRRFGNEKARCPKRLSEKLSRFCPVGRISDAQRSIVESGLRSVIPVLVSDLLPLSVTCRHGRACWRSDPVANGPRAEVSLSARFRLQQSPLILPPGLRKYQSIGRFCIAVRIGRSSLQFTAAYSFKGLSQLSNYRPNWERFALKRKTANRREASILGGFGIKGKKLKCARSLELQRL
jgi:hypothetical protein